MNTRDLFTRYVLDHNALTATGKAVQPQEDATEVIEPAAVRPVEPAYPQVIVMQGRDPATRSDGRTGQLLALAGLGVLGLAAFAIVALVAVAVMAAAVTCAVAVVAVKSLAAASESRGRWSR